MQAAQVSVLLATAALVQTHCCSVPWSVLQGLCCAGQCLLQIVCSWQQGYLSFEGYHVNGCLYWLLCRLLPPPSCPKYYLW